MKIAIMADIHGNMEALEATIEDIKKEKADKIFVLGDLAMAGPNPVEAIDRIIDLSQNKEMSIISGNTDKMIINALNKPGDTTMKAALEYTQSILRNDQIEYIKNLPEQKTEEIGQLKTLLVHGSPRDISENIYPDITEETLKKITEETQEDIIFCGHTHLPATLHINEQTIINTGSVGRPFTENPEACYAILTPNQSDKQFELKHKFVKYDKEKTAEKLRGLSFEGAEKLAEVIISPTKRLELFS